jgi:hypothetical protein
MIEAELESIKNKLKDYNNEDIDLQEFEKKMLKIEKKLLQLENKFNTQDKQIIQEINSDSDTSIDSVSDINIENILCELAKLESDITNINTNISIEKLIENYIDFKLKLNRIKTTNEDFKLKIEYL